MDEIETLERRVRAFSQFAAEPPVNAAPLDVNSTLQERVAFLKAAHPEVQYECRLGEDVPRAMADADMVKGILTNLLENAAEAAGEGGRILGVTAVEDGRIAVEVHDSGPGLSEQARSSLFRADHLVQEAGHGSGAFDCAQERAAVRRGHFSGERRAGRRWFSRALPMATNGIQARSDRG